MIEAVNSVLANSNLLRNAAEQASSAQPQTTEAVKEVARAPYVSPYVFVDVNFDQAVLQIRDSDTGDVLKQFPSESRLEQIRQSNAQRQAELVQDNTSSNPAPQNDTTTTQSAPARQSVPAQPQQTSEVQQAPEAQTAQFQAAVAALSAGSSSGQAQSSGGVSVFA